MGQAAAREHRGAVRVTVVHAPACHLCEDADEALRGLGRSYALDVEHVDIRSDRGQALVRTHRPAMNPLVLVDGEFFSSGRLPRRKLAALLDRRPAASPVSAAATQRRVG